MTPDWLLDRSHISPAESVGTTDVPELQAAGLVPLLVGTGGDDGVAAAFSTCLVWARAEQQRVAQLPWDPLEELTQGLREAHIAAAEELISLSVLNIKQKIEQNLTSLLTCC